LVVFALRMPFIMPARVVISDMMRP
jgi:hypothetical protein